MSTAMRAALAGAFAVGGGPNRLLRAFLWLLAGAVSIWRFRDLMQGYPKFVDVEIPLRAAERWLAGGEPYLASAFQAPPGYELPFLYPPLTLPLIAPLTFLPREVAWAVWLAICVGAAVWLLRRLGVPRSLTPLMLLWPPFAEGIMGCNVQVILVAGFVLVFFDPAIRDWRLRPRDPRLSRRPLLADGLPAAAIPALKISQPQAWVALLRRKPAAAAAGLALMVTVAVATLPLVGVDLWLAWLEQLRLAGDPAWELSGASLSSGQPLLVAAAVVALTSLACLVVPLPRLGAWSGILTTVGAPSLRTFGVLFSLPAMLTVRREIALVAAALIATYYLEGLWLGLSLVLAALLLAERYPALREPAEPGLVTTTRAAPAASAAGQ